VRFLVLLELAQQGKIDAFRPKTLPSVLSQQVISCLYEKKQISLAAMQSLFPAPGGSRDPMDPPASPTPVTPVTSSASSAPPAPSDPWTPTAGDEPVSAPDRALFLLPSVFASLEEKRWLRSLKVKGLRAGGWQYRNHLFEYKIWGNFPETEEEYVLEVSGRAVADIGHSIVAQLVVGDSVFLAGKRLRILKIDKKEEKKVFARPARGGSEKKIVWIGKGPRISHDVAQAMKAVLEAEHPAHGSCLFSRTRKLFAKKRAVNSKKVTLDNGIQVVPGKNARYRYCTFLGSVGNLVLEWSIRESLNDDDLFISSDEIGIESSRWIVFEDLPLPDTREAFHDWIEGNFKILRSLVQLNLFCKTLSRDLVVVELNDFLFDPRVIEAFSRYLEKSSAIVSGNAADLNPRAVMVEDQEPRLLDIIPERSLLATASDRLAGDADTGENIAPWHDLDKTKSQKNGAAPRITATMVSEYFLYRQCQRRFCLQCFGPKAPVQRKEPSRQAVMKQGRIHESEVLACLKEQGCRVVPAAAAGSLKIRLKRGIEELKLLVETVRSGTIPSETPVYLSHCPLSAPAADIGKMNNYPGMPDGQQVSLLFDRERFPVSGMGIPDLLSVRAETINHVPEVVIEPGDIKNSRAPRFHHKWQVAFYALLLESMVKTHGIGATVAETGFLLTASRCGVYDRHSFDLKPYKAAFPMLLETLGSLLNRPESAAGHRLHSRCTTCEWMPCCYRDALENEPVQFLPGLTRGALLKLRATGLTTMAETRAALESGTGKEGGAVAGKESCFTAKQRKELAGQCRAFLENRIVLHKKRTRLFPKNLSGAFFIHVLEDPAAGTPCALAWRMVTPSLDILEDHVWTMADEEERQRVWQKFSQRVSAAWHKSIASGKGPHIFYFGPRTRQVLQQWSAAMETSGNAPGEPGVSRAAPGIPPAFLWQTRPCHWTDLKKILLAHFYMSAPGIASLSTLDHVFNCQGDRPGLARPETLFHSRAGVS
ncbi:MAG: hypothetical protein R6V54_15320, partial [Desulfobacteraceae bacterium]